MARGAVALAALLLLGGEACGARVLSSGAGAGEGGAPTGAGDSGSRVDTGARADAPVEGGVSFDDAMTTNPQDTGLGGVDAASDAPPTFVVDCSGVGSCFDFSSPQCPDGQPCLIRCSGKRSCNGGSLFCPLRGTCTIECSGEASCQQVDVGCNPAENCIVDCSGFTSCNGSSVQCNGGPCEVTCPANDAGGQTLGSVSCGSQCTNCALVTPP